MLEFYDKTGKPITLNEWARLRQAWPYRIVQQDQVGDLLVSTVWIGIDQSFGMMPGLPPLIFETMVLAPTMANVGPTGKQATEDQALAEHDQVLAAVQDGTWPDE